MSTRSPASPLISSTASCSVCRWGFLAHSAASVKVGLHVNGHIGMELVEENGVVVEGVARHRRPQGQLPAEIILAGRGHRLHGLHGVLRRLPLSLRQGRAVNGLLVCVAAGEESEQEAKYKKHAYEFFHDNPPSIGGGPPSRNGSANTPRASITWRRWYNSNQM